MEVKPEVSMNKDKFNLSNKTALITGSSGLLGYQHSLALLDSGSDIVLTDIDERTIEDIRISLQKIYPKNSIYSFVMDVTNKEQIQEVNKELLSNGVEIDILINNAAIDPKVTNGDDLDKNSRLENFSLEQWNIECAVGLTGAFLCSQVFGSYMAKRNKGGVILNIASDLSVIAPDQRLYEKEGLSDEEQPVKPITYSVIKSGLVGLTKYLSTYWSRQGIRCNALSPGGIYLDQSEEFVKKIESLIPLGRMATSDEYRSTVQYLCSDASAYLNGQNIVVDGGRSVL
tara:strand:+ start:2301 stop:3158 length:858 start_codon:yes stop_codon:yes gene_type:complete